MKVPTQKMRKRTASQIATFLLGPWMILPQAFAVGGFVGGFLYEPPEIHRQLERHLFLQGNTDWGGGCTFAAAVALYVAFGFTAAWYLVLRMREAGTPASLGGRLWKAGWALKFHVAAFVVGGTADWGYDARVTPNDFRSMFLLAGLVYLLSVAVVVGTSRTRIPIAVRLVLAPAFTVAWLVVGSDGNTARAGQLVQSGQDPQPITRGTRHGIMLAWHRACDSVFGDIGER
jgi:hypothetical protein